jgi:ABC-type multidrug transport system permease subunit
MFNSSWLVDEKENGTLQRLISSSGALSSLFFGNILSLLFVGSVHVVLFAAVSKIIFGIDLLLNPINILVLFLYLLCTIGISLLISSILKTRLQLQSGAPLFSIITGFIGGCFWNFSEISGIIKTVSLFTPQGLALDLFNKYGLIEAEGFSQRASILKTMILSPQALILLTVALITTLLSYELIKRLRY